MKRLLLTVLMFIFITVAQAQVPQKLNYQGVARNESGSPITYQNITVRISIIDSAAGGQVVYRETRRVMTNYVGLFNILIGSAGATNVLGSIQDVNWPTGKKHIKLEIDPNGLNNFSLAGVTELQSVPYALSALPAGLAGGDLTGTYPYPRIADDAITNNKIADGIISFSKLDPDLAKTLTNKLNISDTASMLSPYATKTQLSVLSASKLNTSDTAEMLSPYYHSSTAEAEFATTNSNLNNEISRATNAESALKTDLSSEVNRAISAETSKEDVSNKSIDGTFASNSDTKYPSEKATKTYVDTATSQNLAALASEVTRATAAEGDLTSKLSKESSDRTTADSTETSDRTNSDNLIASNLDREIISRTTGDSTLSANLSTEITNSQNADSALNAAKEDVANKSTDIIADGSSDTKYPTVKSIKDYVDAFSSGSNTDISAEIAHRNAGDSTLTSSLSAESSERAIADSTESAKRADADSLLNSTKEDIVNKSTDIIADGSSDTKYPTVKSVKDYVDAFSTGSNTDISAEIANRIAGDSTLTSTLSAESFDRAIADSTESAKRTDADNLLMSNLSVETTSRATADSTLAANLNTEITNRSDRDSLLNSTKENVANKSTDIIADGSSDTKYPTVKSVKDYVDAFSTGSNTDISAEIANRIAGDSTETANRTDADNLLTSNLSIETTSRATADSTLAANLNTEITNRSDRDSLLNSTKENVANKSTDIIADGSSDTKYPTVKSVKDYVDAFSTGSNTNISAEIANRIAADSTETANRIDADNLLTSNLSVETTSRATADSLEEVNRTDADSIIVSNLNNEVSRATVAEAAKEDLANKSTDIAADASSDTKYPSVKSVKNYLDSTAAVISEEIATAITTATTTESALTTNLATETINRIYADSTITSNLNNETIRATTAETLLGTNKENVSNKSTDIAADAASNIKYPTVKTIKDYVDGKLTTSDNTNQTAIDLKVNIADTAAMLSSYTRAQRMIDSLALVQSRLNLKLNIADTTAMLSPYATVAGSNAGLNTKVNISDTAAMLSPYARTQRMIDSLALVQSRLNLKLNIADTAAMLSPYATIASATSGLNTKVNISDTTAMLSPYARIINDATDEFAATALETSFTLTQIPSTHSKVKMYINGIRISNSAYSWSGKTLTYDASKNGSYSLTASDRIQFDYFY